MKIAVVSTYDAKNVKPWAGTPANISKMLDSIFKEDISYINHPVERTRTSYLLGFYYNKVMQKKYLSWTDMSLIKKSNNVFKTDLNNDFDLIITFEFYLVPIIKNNSKAKIIYWNDATFNNLINFYSYVTNVCNYSLKQGHSYQKLAFDMSNCIIFSSDWAINSAIKNYNVNKKKLKRITFGSNLSKQALETEVSDIIKLRKNKIIKFLFLAVDWERKGGEDAVEIVNILNKKGIESVLYVVGTDVPEAYKYNKSIIACGYINKNSPEGETQLIELLKSSTFLLIPSRADCTPIAFSEANSFALPIITTNVGGIPSIINNNVNGCALEISSFVEESVKFILNNLQTSDNYTSLCHSSYNYYQENMSWNQVKRNFKKILLELDITY